MPLTPPVILAVDDEPSLLGLMCMVLEDAGYKVITAENGEDAFRLCKDAPPDLVISDVSMPGMNGLELAGCVSRLPGAIPVILVSGFPETCALVGSIASQFQEFRFLQKPFLPHDLRAAVADALGTKAKAA